MKELTGIVGLFLIVAGVSMMSVPWACIVAGALLAAVEVTGERNRRYGIAHKAAGNVQRNKPAESNG